MTQIFGVLSVWISSTFTSLMLGFSLADVTSWSGWDVFGWAFGGSTVFVAVEIIQRVERKTYERILQVGVGLFVSMGLSEWVASLEIHGIHFPIQITAIALGFGGYILASKLKVRAEKAESLKDLTGGDAP